MYGRVSMLSSVADPDPPGSTSMSWTWMCNGGTGNESVCYRDCLTKTKPSVAILVGKLSL